MGFSAYLVKAVSGRGGLIFFHKPSLATRRRNVADAYEVRSIIKQRRENDYSISPSLLDQLRDTAHAHICISIFVTDQGVFTIFSDFERTEIIGILFTKEQPKEPPVYSLVRRRPSNLSRPFKNCIHAIMHLKQGLPKM